MKKIYLAAGWFTAEQKQHRDFIRSVLKDLKLPHYSPEHDGTRLTLENQEAVYKENLKMIEDSSFVLASTTGKDVGTMFECGMAAAIQKPIVYVWLGSEPGMKFNLMLAQSATAVLETKTGLYKYLESIQKVGSGIPHKLSYGGNIE